MDSSPNAPLRKQALWKRALRFAAMLGVGYLFVMVVAMFLENHLLFFPHRYPSGEWHPAGIEFEDAWFEAEDGTRLHGWYVPHSNPRATVLFCHGNAGNVTHRVGAIKALHDLAGVSVLVFDYRGYGRSDGKPTGSGILSDARAARNWLADREKIPLSDVVLLGESIGGAVAVNLAAADGARGLVLESTFDALPEVAAHHYPWLPVRWLMRNRFDSAGLIGRYQGPLLQAHGDADRIVPVQHGRRLFETANDPKQFMLLPGHDHNDPMPREYYDSLASFLDQL